MSMNPLLRKAYWALAGMGALYFVSLGCLMNPWVQNKYKHLSRTPFWNAADIVICSAHYICTSCKSHGGKT